MKQVYEFVEKIGTGKFSTVFKAKLRSSPGRLYAIKVVDLKTLAPEEAALIA